MQILPKFRPNKLIGIGTIVQPANNISAGFGSKKFSGPGVTTPLPPPNWGGVAPKVTRSPTQVRMWKQEKWPDGLKMHIRLLAW